MNMTPTREGPRINEEISVLRVRLVDERGGMVGVVGRNEALTMAADAGLDLVEIAPGADPPVCKILDYGKYKYEEQKKKNEARKKQKIIEVKEIKDGKITGLIASDVEFISKYKYGDIYVLPETDLIDWTISKPDGTEEGNFVGNFLDTYKPN